MVFSRLDEGGKYIMVTTYETDLLNPIWWMDSLLGNTFIAIAVIQLFLLSYIRKIPNINTMSFVLVAINAVLLFYAVFRGEGASLGTGLLTLVILVWAVIAYTGYENS